MKNTLLTLALFSAFNANANLIENGSFESYAVADNTYALITDTSTWKPVLGAPDPFLEIQRNFSFFNALPTAQDGNNYAELSTLTGATGISQSFSLAAATTGDLSFWIKSRFSSESNSNGFNVLLNDNPVFSLPNTSSAGISTSWTQLTFNGLSLGAGFNTLSFTSTSPDDIGIHLDNVVLTAASVAAIPEPETYAMFLAGLGLLGFAARRRQS
jgi:hypothetical protein